ncbi:MAG TPA: response regulator [Planctomycetota bacterium]|nr:response regulator [Planctomycetota bacterium]
MAGAERKTVLVVEDNRDIAELLGQLLRAYNCDVLTAESMDEVEKAVAGRRIDLLLLDILLPEEVDDGRKIAKRLREAGHRFPIYFLSGLRPPDVGKEYLGLVDGFLRKPFSLRDLRELLNSTLGQPAPEAAPNTSFDLMGAMAAIATEQEEIRRQQARLANFVTILQDGEAGAGGPGRALPPEVMAKFAEDSARYEEGLARVEKSLNEVQEMLRRHGADLLGKQRRGVRAAE